MWQDEGVTYEMAHRSLPQLSATLGNADVVHGLYYLLMHGVFCCWDGGLVALRLPSVTAASVAAAGVAAIGREVAGPRAGLVAGILFSLLPMVQRYSQEGRSYALVAALVTWATWALITARATRRHGLWVVYGVLALLSCLLHEFAFLAILAHGLTLAWNGSAQDIRKWAGAVAFVLLPLVPLALASMNQAQQVAWIDIDAGSVGGFLLLSSLGLASALLLSWNRGRHGPEVTGRPFLVRLALPLLIAPPAVLLAASVVKPLYVDRYVLYSTVGLALLGGAAFDHLWQSGRMRLVLVPAAIAAVVVALVPVGGHLRSPDSRSDDVEAISGAVRQMASAGEPVLYLPASRRVWMLQDTPESMGLVDIALAEDVRASHTLHGRELPAARIRQLMRSAQRILVVAEPSQEQAEGNAQEGVERSTLGRYFKECARRDVGPARVVVYGRPGACGATADR